MSFIIDVTLQVFYQLKEQLSEWVQENVGYNENEVHYEPVKDLI